MDKKTLGNFIKIRREELSITQNDIASFFNITTQAVSRWENGLSYPDFTLLGDLASLLKLNINDLITLNNNPIPYEEKLKFNYLTFGETIEKYLKSYNLSQEQFSKITKINQSSISNIINGKSYPTIEQFITISNSLNVPYNDLYFSIYQEKEEKIIIKKTISIHKILPIAILSSLLIIFISQINTPKDSTSSKNDYTSLSNTTPSCSIDLAQITDPLVEFWDENDNLIEANIIQHKRRNYYPDIVSPMWWDKPIDIINTSSIFRMNKNPYKYYFYIETKECMYEKGYDSILEFNNLDFSGKDLYLSDTFKDKSGNIVDIKSLEPGIHYLYGENLEVKTHTINFPYELNLPAIDIKDAELIKNLPTISNEDNIIYRYKYNDIELSENTPYPFEKSINVTPIVHLQKTLINDEGNITHLSTNKDTIIIPDTINNIKVKGIINNAIQLNENNNKLLFLNKNRLDCNNIFNNEEFISNIQYIETKYNFITPESYLGNIKNLKEIKLFQDINYHNNLNNYSLKNLSNDNSFSIDNLYYDSDASKLFTFEDLNINNVYFDSKEEYCTLGAAYMFKNSTINNFYFSSDTIKFNHVSFNSGSFYNCKNLREIKLPFYTDFCGDKIFYNCENLRDITFYGNVSNLTNETFSNTKVESLKINNVNFVKNNAFKDSIIKEIDIIDCIYIEKDCFLPSTLKDFYIGGEYTTAIDFTNLK